MTDNPAEGLQEPDGTVDAPPTSIGELAERMGIRFSEHTPELLVASMPVAGNTQPYGLLHGGATAALAETMGSVGAALHAARQGKIAMGIELSITHHRAVSAGHVVGTARPLHLGGTLASYEIRIADGRERLVSTARLTCVLRRALESRVREPLTEVPPDEVPPPES